VAYHQRTPVGAVVARILLVKEVLLVTAPFAATVRSSLGLSLLRAALARRDVPARILYLNLRFAGRIGCELYDEIAEGSEQTLLLGDWIFSPALFRDSAPDSGSYAREFLEPSYGVTRIRALRAAQRAARSAIDEWAAEIVAREPAFVGFTSVVQQHVAALALARRIKELRPETFVAIGGPNCEGVMGMETARQFPFLDAVVSGEGDEVIVDLVERAHAGRSVDDLPGVWTAARAERGEDAGHARRIASMDALPVPQYEDYLEDYSRIGSPLPPQLLFETSRGCWWGEKLHCTFCGLNGGAMAFRSKSPERAIAEIVELSSRHPGLMLQAADNILDMRYFGDVLPELARRRLGTELFYETKSNLKKEQLRAMRDAGVLRFQPGVESLSSEVLRRMRKGVTGMQNVQLLKWSKELGLRPIWFVIYGFPGESEREYRQMARAMPLLAHLPAPLGTGPLRVHRFSPNFDRPESLGFTNVRPAAAYRQVYPFAEDVLRNLAYTFDHDYAEPWTARRAIPRLERAALRWLRHAKRSDLFSVDAGGRLVVFDLRPDTASFVTVLSGLDYDVYRLLDPARSAATVAEHLPGASTQSVQRSLLRLLRSDLVYEEGGKHLALALPLETYTPPERIVAEWWGLLRRCSRRVGDEIEIRLEGGAVSWRDHPAALGPPPEAISPATFGMAADGSALRIRVPRRLPRRGGRYLPRPPAAETQTAAAP
jgi:ribosomal peptide maturation radical SAM protein 1